MLTLYFSLKSLTYIFKVRKINDDVHRLWCASQWLELKLAQKQGSIE